MTVLYTLLVEYVIGAVLVIPRALPATRFTPPLGRWRRVAAIVVAVLVWPYSTARLLWEEFR